MAPPTGGANPERYTPGGGEMFRQSNDKQYAATCPKCGAIRHDAGIGLEPTPEEWVANMVQVFREVWRVLRDDGVVFLNLGDAYYGGGGAHKEHHANPGLSKSFSRGGVPRAAAYDTSDKVPEDSQERDCLCRSLCDACRVAYRIGKSRNDKMPVPKLGALSPMSNPGHTESQRGHLPTSDYRNQRNRTSSATQEIEHLLGHDDGPPLSSRESRQLESLQQRPEGFPQSDSLFLCLLCGSSLTDDAQEFDHRSGDSFEQPSHNQNNASADAQQENHSQNKDTVCEYCNASWVDYTTASRNIPLKPKDLIGMPWRLAFALQAAGWYLRSDIIWAKPNPMPESVTDRPTKAHEYVFLLSKSKRYFYDSDAIREGEQVFTRKAGGYHGRDGENASRFGGKGGFGDSDVTTVGRNKRTVWSIATAPYSGAHFATFPPKLIEPMVRAGTSEHGVCPECGAPWKRVTEVSYDHINYTKPREHSSYVAQGGQVANKRTTTLGFTPTCSHEHDPIPATVFDPFVGSGTTIQVARALGRRGIGIDLSAEYLQLARKRLELDKLDDWGKGVKDEAVYDELPLFNGLYAE